MARKHYDIGWLFCLILFLPSCGNDASVDAVILPADQTSTGCTINAKGSGGAPTVVGSCQTTGPIQFHVQKTADDTTPVGDADVRIDIGNSVGDQVFLMNSAGTACFNGGDPNAVPTPSDCLSQTVRTDKFGVVSFQVLTFFFGCGAATADITSSSNAQVTISNSHATWHMDNTIKCT